MQFWLDALMYDEAPGRTYLSGVLRSTGSPALRSSGGFFIAKLWAGNAHNASVPVPADSLPNPRTVSNLVFDQRKLVFDRHLASDMNW